MRPDGAQETSPAARPLAAVHFIKTSISSPITCLRISPLQAMLSVGFALPPEVLYDVVGLVFSEHLDALIAGKRKLQNVPPPSSEDDSGDNVLDSPPPLSVRGEPSTIASLLQATYQIRHVTLKVLSDALGLEMDDAGIGR